MHASESSEEETCVLSRWILNNNTDLCLWFCSIKCLILWSVRFEQNCFNSLATLQRQHLGSQFRCLFFKWLCLCASVQCACAVKVDKYITNKIAKIHAFHGVKFAKRAGGMRKMLFLCMFLSLSWFFSFSNCFFIRCCTTVGRRRTRVSSETEEKVAAQVVLSNDIPKRGGRGRSRGLKCMSLMFFSICCVKFLGYQFFVCQTSLSSQNDDIIPSHLTTATLDWPIFRLHRSVFCRVSESVEFNSPPDTIQVILEAVCSVYLLDCLVVGTKLRKKVQCWTLLQCFCNLFVGMEPFGRI